MKSVVGFAFAGCMYLVSCASASREIQVERTTVQLIKIDTLYRESGNVKAFTWEAGNRVRFYSIEPLESQIQVGSTFGMLIRR